LSAWSAAPTATERPSRAAGERGWGGRLGTAIRATASRSWPVCTCAGVQILLLYNRNTPQWVVAAQLAGRGLARGRPRCEARAAWRTAPTTQPPSNHQAGAAEERQRGRDCLAVHVGCGAAAVQPRRHRLREGRWGPAGAGLQGRACGAACWAFLPQLTRVAPSVRVSDARALMGLTVWERRPTLATRCTIPAGRWCAHAGPMPPVSQLHLHCRGAERHRPLCPPAVRPGRRGYWPLLRCCCCCDRSPRPPTKIVAGASFKQMAALAAPKSLRHTHKPPRPTARPPQDLQPPGRARQQGPRHPGPGHG
jgi:hypothetical protein